MKLFLFNLFFFLSICSFSQTINVSTTTYTVPQLVNNVLLNSSCVAATNIVSSTGTNFNSVNGIGSFTNTNPNFPIQSGIILSTGNVLNAVGPNNSTLSDGSNLWPGDADLAAATGITNPLNASYIQFDFTPISSNFSFDFIFASEEYGNFQCNFSDAFAFLLTNTVTGVTTNLAVVPGSITPISVGTIRDQTYNGSCSSVNANYFGNYYGGTNSNLSPTNFNGETVLITASATLTPNVPYTIKLVIADSQTTTYDSAVFISGTSFNAGQDVLGPDLTVANNTAICFGKSYTINTSLDPLQYTFNWSKNGATPAPGGSTYLVNGPGNYQVTYLKNGSTCAPQVNNIIIEYYPEIIPTAPINIYRCDSGLPTYSFNIAQNTPILLSGNPGLPAATTTINYYISQANAENKVAPISSPYTSPAGVTIYVRIENTITKCFTIKTFQLLTINIATTATQPSDLIQCETVNGSQNSYFSFGQQDTTILNGQSSTLFEVLYYDTQANANAGGSIGLLPNNGSLQVTGTKIYARVQVKTDPSCSAFTDFNVIVNPKPEIPDIVKDKIVCVNYILPPVSAGVQYWTLTGGTGTQLFPGDAIDNSLPFLAPQPIYLFIPSACFPPIQKSFSVAVIDLLILKPVIGPQCGEYLLPGINYASYWTGSHTAGNNPGVEILPGTKITTSQTLYIYYKSLEAPFCEQELPFPITIEPLPVVPTYTNIFKCVGQTYTLPALTQPTNGTIGYYSQKDGGGTQYASDGTAVISASTFIHVFVTLGTIPCTKNGGFYVNIGLTPPNPPDQCTSFQLPAVIAGTNYFTGPSGTGTMLAPQSFITTSQTIYLYALTGGTPCTAIDEPFTVLIILPEILPSFTAPIQQCDVYTLPPLPTKPVNTNVTPNQSYAPFFYNTQGNGLGANIAVGTNIVTSKTIFVCVKDQVSGCVSGLQLPITIIQNPTISLDKEPIRCDKDPYLVSPIANVIYYDQPRGTGNVIPNNSTIDVSKLIYAYSNFGGCTNELPITITIIPSIPAVYPINATFVTACDSYPLPALSNPPAPGSPTRCFATADGPNTPGFVEYFAGHIFTASQTVYFYNENPIRGNYKCTDGNNPFLITINTTPILPVFGNITTCDSYKLPSPPLLINTANPSATTTVKYFSQSGGNGTQYLAGDTITDNKTVFVFAETATTPNCTDEKSFTVTINKVSTLPAVSACGSYNLPLNTNDTVPKPIEGDYYTGMGGTGIMIPKGTAITPTYPPITGTPSTTTVRIFYIYKKYTSTENPSGFCESETQFVLTVISPPIANDIPLADRTICDEFDADNDGFYKQDLSLLNPLILNPTAPPTNYINQVGPEFTVTYYNSSADANANPPLKPITTTTDNKNVWVRVTNTLAPNCYDIKQLEFFVNKIPETNPKDGAICIDNVTLLPIGPYLIKSGLPVAGYTFEWNDSKSTTPISASNNLSVTVPEIYSVVATDNITGCKSKIKFAKVILSTKAILSYTLSENFSDNQYITVNAVGSGGDYVYQLDDASEQDSPIFENVPYGPHLITVRDRNGCGITSIDIIVINYPKFFTPNGDGFHDTWNVIGLENFEITSNIFIYDRFGKLITQIKPYGLGWDGTFNGVSLPSTDYWFAVTYLENNTEKVFKSHFTLKR